MVVVNSGLAECAKLIGSGLGGNKWRSVALDGSATAPSDTQTALVSELASLGAGRKASAEVTKTLETTNFADDTMRFVASWGLTGTIAINGFGVFNDDAASSGDMLLRDTFAAAFNGQSADVIELTIDVVTDDKTQDETGQPSQVITDAGIVEMNKLLLEGQTATRFSHLAMDDSNTPANQTQTALASEFATLGLSRGAATVSQETVNVAGDTTQFLLQFSVTGTAGADGTGVFNAASSGDMLARWVYALTLNLVDTDTYTQICQIIHVNA